MYMAVAHICKPEEGPNRDETLQRIVSLIFSILNVFCVNYPTKFMLSPIACVLKQFGHYLFIAVQALVVD